jgi:uncharacterized protein YbjT (DUF2867 family)
MGTGSRVAIVIGATGLVGHQLVLLLLKDPRFSAVKVFARRPSGLKDPKLQEQVIDFDKLDEQGSEIRGDVLFSAMGTTVRTAGSKSGQRRVDYDYQYNTAAIAAHNGVATYVLISAAGANAGSPFFYMRMKGELEQAVSKLPFKNIHILQPGFLDGDRAENRPGEKIGLALTKLVTKMGPLHRHRPILDRTVARAMIAASFETSGPLKVHSPTSLFDLAERAGIS